MYQVYLALILIIILILVLAAIFIGYQWGKVSQRLTALEAQLPKRHTYSTIAGLEDAMAVIIDIQMNLDADRERIESAHQILQTLRSGPRSYYPDRPAGKRPDKFRERITK